MVTEFIPKNISKPSSKKLTGRTPIMVRLYDYKKAKFVYVNDYIEDFLGYTPEEFLSLNEKQVFSSVHPDDRSLVCQYEQSIQDKGINSRTAFNKIKPTSKFDYRFKHKDGHYVMLHTEKNKIILPHYENNEYFLETNTLKDTNKKNRTKLGLVYDDIKNGELRNKLDFLNLLSDYNDHKKRSGKISEIPSEKNLSLIQSSENTINELEQIQFNKAKDEFIALASHQLRTPATAVMQYIGLLRSGYVGKLTDDQLMYINKAYESNRRQLKIVDSLLKVALLDAGKVKINYQDTDLVELAKGIIQEQSNVLKDKDQTVDLVTSKDKIIGSIDPELMKMVLENLLTNASKYSKENNKISVKINDQMRNISISFTDQGIGIYPNDIKKLFNKFTRLENAKSTTVGGSGLGLYWAKEIIDMHGGKISVKSKPAKGSTFTIKLPKNPNHRN